MDINATAIEQENKQLWSIALGYCAQVAASPHFVENETIQVLRKHLESLMLLYSKENPFFPRPRIICLCGSTRFLQAFQDANLQQTLNGHIVLTVGCDTKSDAMLVLTSEQKAMLDELHKRKIDLADEVLILNIGGYIGSSTASEIAYARTHNKHIRWLEGCYTCGRIENLISCDICGDRCCPEHHFSTPPSEFGDLFKDAERNILECLECGCK
jgi:hypothetical protein